MYSFPYWEPVCCSMSSSNCCFLTRIHASQKAGLVVWYSYLFQNFPQFVIHTVKQVWIIAIHLSTVGFDIIPLVCKAWLPPSSKIRVLLSSHSYYQRQTLYVELLFLLCLYFMLRYIAWQKAIWGLFVWHFRKNTLYKRMRNSDSQILPKSSEPQLTYLLNGGYNMICIEGIMYD